MAQSLGPRRSFRRATEKDPLHASDLVAGHAKRNSSQGGVRSCPGPGSDRRVSSGWRSEANGPYPAAMSALGSAREGGATSALPSCPPFRDELRLILARHNATDWGGLIPNSCWSEYVP